MPIEKLAVLYPKAIGDFVFALPALHTLRRALPETHITLVVKRKQAPLAEPQQGSLVDEVLTLGGRTGIAAVRRRLSRRAPDAVVDMAGNDQSGLLLAWRRGRRLRPHPNDCKGSCALYTPWAESMPRQAPGIHRVEELLAYAQCVTDADPVYSFRMALPDSSVEAGEDMIARHRLRGGSLVVLNVGASRSAKRWPAAHFRALAESLIAKGHRVAFTGARNFRADDDYDRAFAAQAAAWGLVDGERCIDLIMDGADLSPALHLQRDAYFLRYSGVPRVVVGCDTGPLHIAGSVGEDARRKTVSLFGPTNWGRYAPFDPSRSYPGRASGEWNRVVCADLPCRPTGTTEACRCYRRGCSTDACMAALSPDTVLAAVLDGLATSDRDAGSNSAD